MRWFSRSATNSRPLESNASEWGVENSPGADPFFPQVLMNFPSFENFTIRAFESPPCPSPTKISPLEATATADGRLKVSGPSPATPALPSVINTFPSALNLKTWWPLPSPPWESVAHTFPSLSMKIPCGTTNSPAPKLFTSLLEESNSRMGASVCPTQVLPPHLSATQTLPSRSKLNWDVCPQVLPSGSFAQPSIVRYGLGGELGSACAYAVPPSTAIVAKMAPANVNLKRKE